jgi:hypothetical protein
MANNNNNRIISRYSVLETAKCIDHSYSMRWQSYTLWFVAVCAMFVVARVCVCEW